MSNIYYYYKNEIKWIISILIKLAIKKVLVGKVLVKKSCKYRDIIKGN